MESRAVAKGQRQPSVVCLSAVADVVARLPLLYRVVEHGDDDVRIELHLKAGSREVLRFVPAGGDNVACFLAPDLERPAAAPSAARLTRAVEILDADLHWAASQPCAEQGHSILAALVRFRGSML
jgi:hypothetical protein